MRAASLLTMKKPLPIPQHEFGFVPDTFSLFMQTAVDGERIARELAERAAAREAAEKRQALLDDEVTRLETLHDRAL